MKQTCAHPSCNRTFTPRRSDAKYCTDVCRARASRARRRAKAGAAPHREPPSPVAAPVRERPKPVPPPAMPSPPPAVRTPARRPPPDDEPQWAIDLEGRVIGIRSYSQDNEQRIRRLSKRVDELNAEMSDLNDAVVKMQQMMLEWVRAMQG